MADTYTLIERISVGATGASSVTFTSIPQTYTDLKVVASARNTTATLDCYINFNGSNTNLSRRVLYGNGSSATSSSGSDGYVIWLSQSTDTANTFGNAEIYIPNYTSSNNKSFGADSVTENNATQAYQFFQAGLWSNSAAITSISLFSGSTFAQYSTFYLYGIAKEGVTPTPSSAPYATGGDSIVFDGTYWIHTFTSSGTFTPKKALSCDYLVVAGGGGGGEEIAGGGGAGGLRSTVTATGGGGSLESALALAANTGYTVTIGAGGSGGVFSTNTAATNGSNSVFSTITSTGGGRGGSYTGTDTNGNSGGSGGGASMAGGGGTVGGAGTANQGYAGADGFSGSYRYAGGGGGAGAAAVTVTSGSVGSAGGVGIATSISGSSTYYAGGGGGAIHSGGTAGTGGTGGGGNGGNNTGVAGTAGTANTGGGGGGGGNNANGGAGGSGIVIVRYAA